MRHFSVVYFFSCPLQLLIQVPSLFFCYHLSVRSLLFWFPPSTSSSPPFCSLPPLRWSCFPFLPSLHLLAVALLRVHLLVPALVVVTEARCDGWWCGPGVYVVEWWWWNNASYPEPCSQMVLQGKAMLSAWDDSIFSLVVDFSSPTSRLSPSESWMLQSGVGEGCIDCPQRKRVVQTEFPVSVGEKSVQWDIACLKSFSVDT